MNDQHLNLNDYRDTAKLVGAKVECVENKDVYFIVRINEDFDNDVVDFGVSKDIRAKEPEFEINKETLVDKYRVLGLAPSK